MLAVKEVIYYIINKRIEEKGEILMLKPTPIEVDDQEINLDNSVRALYVLTFPDTENQPQKGSKPTTRATSMYKSDAIKFVANMTKCSEAPIVKLN